MRLSNESLRAVAETSCMKSRVQERKASSGRVDASDMMVLRLDEVADSVSAK